MMRVVCVLLLLLSHSQHWLPALSSVLSSESAVYSPNSAAASRRWLPVCVYARPVSLLPPPVSLLLTSIDRRRECKVRIPLS